MARRSVFSDPPDYPFDDVLSSLASSPPPSAKSEPVPVQPPVTSPEPAPVEQRAPVPSAPVAVAPAPRAVVALPKAKAKAAVGKGKRVGLYLDTNSWMALKEIGLARARKGLPTDFTTIVLEALKKEYPNSRWSI